MDEIFSYIFDAIYKMKSIKLVGCIHHISYDELLKTLQLSVALTIFLFRTTNRD
jgi:hypothetical protein